MALGVRLQLAWAHQLRYRQGPSLDHSRLRWYRDATTTYRLTVGYLIPLLVKPFARITVEGLEHVPSTGPVILAANHRDNLDGYLLMRLVPRMVHVAGRPDAFGTGALCALWRRLGVFPADPWGMRHALTLLADGAVVAIFPQATISAELGKPSGAVGLLARRSGAPVVPIAISGTDAVQARCPFMKRAAITVRVGAPMRFERGRPGAAGSLAVASQILQRVGALLDRPTLRGDESSPATPMSPSPDAIDGRRAQGRRGHPCLHRRLVPPTCGRPSWEPRRRPTAAIDDRAIITATAPMPAP
jgi:1-acyl-sn-glycerol-3-phosphate acyltransferase